MILDEKLRLKWGSFDVFDWQCTWLPCLCARSASAVAWKDCLCGSGLRFVLLDLFSH